jgi:protein involved in sex pheromone biosynthesis
MKKLLLAATILLSISCNKQEEAEYDNPCWDIHKRCRNDIAGIYIKSSVYDTFYVKILYKQHRTFLPLVDSQLYTNRNCIEFPLKRDAEYYFQFHPIKNGHSFKLKQTPIQHVNNCQTVHLEYYE